MLAFNAYLDTSSSQVLAHFGKFMPLLFLNVSQDACARVRRQLKMVNNQSFFLEVQSPFETQKRITILPENLTQENKAVLKQHFESKLQELEWKDANKILVCSSPKDINMLKAKMIRAHMVGSSKNTAMAEQAVVQFCQYPPDSPGTAKVSITNEDYNCLEAEQFLNDRIIDFYLKYIQTELFGTVDQWSKRTHIFTTYFYKRLTTRPPNSKTKAHPIEDNPNLSAAEKRYERVKNWTKKVNIFDKDFIIVPINEHAHWFVCVICFPGQEGCMRADDGTACKPVASSKIPGTKKRVVKKPTMQIGATTIIPLSGREDVSIRYNVENYSDRDEAEASDDDMEDEEGEGVVARKPGEKGKGCEPPPAVRRPCILIFDSLKGGSKARTCQTLRDYLSCEWKAKMVPNGKEKRKFDNGLMPGSQPTVQQQPNFSDCGIYLLQYIQSFFRDPISDYNFPIRSVRQWFSKEDVEGKRGNIAELIRKLTGEQNPEKEIKFPQLNFLNPEIEREESTAKRIKHTNPLATAPPRITSSTQGDDDNVIYVGGLMAQDNRATAGRGQEEAGGADDGAQEAALVHNLHLPAAMRGPRQRQRPPCEQWIVREALADDVHPGPAQPAAAVEPELPRVLSRCGRYVKPSDQYSLEKDRADELQSEPGSLDISATYSKRESERDDSSTAISSDLNSLITSPRSSPAATPETSPDPADPSWVRGGGKFQGRTAKERAEDIVERHRHWSENSQEKTIEANEDSDETMKVAQTDEAKATARAKENQEQNDCPRGKPTTKFIERYQKRKERESDRHQSKKSKHESKKEEIPETEAKATAETILGEISPEKIVSANEESDEPVKVAQSAEAKAAAGAKVNHEQNDCPRGKTTIERNQKRKETVKDRHQSKKRKTMMKSKQKSKKEEIPETEAKAISGAEAALGEAGTEPGKTIEVSQMTTGKATEGE